MKVSTTDDKNNNGKRRLEPPISLDRPEREDLKKDQYLTFKLRSNPTVDESPTYEHSVRFFKQGTPEQWLLFNRDLGQVITGLNITTGPPMYAMARRLLQGDALSTFNNAATIGNETIANYQACLRAVSNIVFPKKAAQTQKRYMRRFLRKPKTWKTREWVSRLQELNLYLEKFPPATDDGPAPVRLPDDELIDIIEFGVPVAWQKEMVRQDFDPMIFTIAEVIEFCERMERVGDADATNNNNSKDNHKSSNGKKVNKSKKRRSDDEDETKYCMLHGNNNTHGTAECRVLKAQAKKMKGTYEAQHPSQKKAYKDKQELHALIAESVERALKMKKRKKKASATSEVDELNHFEQLSVSSSSGAEEEMANIDENKSDAESESSDE